MNYCANFLQQNIFSMKCLFKSDVFANDFLTDTCKPGEYSPTGYQPCTKCPVGTFTNSNSATICQSCPTGTSTLQTGSSHIDQCKGKV